MSTPRHLNSYSQGYALCTPGGTLLGHTYRASPAEAVAASFPSTNPFSAAAWAERQKVGWTVEHVFARVFTPMFFKPGDAPDGEKIEEPA